jgi:PAS domain S-box-containing protein
MLRDAEGNITGVAGVGQDVTDGRRAAERIAEQAALLDKTQDAIHVRDLEGRVMFWSNGAERLYGWTAEEAVGMKITGLVYDKDTRKLEEGTATVMEKGEWRAVQYYERQAPCHGGGAVDAGAGCAGNPEIHSGD